MNSTVASCAALILVAAPNVTAATYRYSSSSDRIYVENGGTATLTAIKAALPKAPLDLIDAGGRVWLLRTNLLIEDGTTLLLRGSAAGGDVNELRLKSDSTGFVALTGDQGRIEIRSTLLRSWDASRGGPDTNVADGRAYVRVRSRLAADGSTALESRMDVIDSEVAYLGYNASESQGLAWKVLGSLSAQPRLFDLVQVRGDILRSHIHHNYFGVYTYGHQGGQWLDNEVAYNLGYGIDPHDDSDDLLIQNNYVHHNGHHGIIASKRCDHPVMRGNRSWDNKGNGIMLHRGIDDALLEDNDLRRNGDSGIAVYASLRSTLRNNLVLDNLKSGIRFSNGAADGFVEDNEIAGSGTYGLYLYKGNDAPEPGDDGHPKRNVFSGNLVRDGLREGIKLADSDENRFIGNRFSGNGTSLSFERARLTELIGNIIPSNVTVRLTGSSSIATHLYLETQPFVRLAVDGFSAATFSDPGRAVFDVTENVPSIADTTRSTMQLASAQIGTSTQVFTRNMLATPSAARVEITITLWETSAGFNKAWSARLTSSTASVAYTVGDLVPGQRYRVTQGTSLVGSFTADATGRVVFTHAPGSTLRLNYALGPA